MCTSNPTHTGRPAPLFAEPGAPASVWPRGPGGGAQPGNGHKGGGLSTCLGNGADKAAPPPPIRPLCGHGAARGASQGPAQAHGGAARGPEKPLPPAGPAAASPGAAGLRSEVPRSLSGSRSGRTRPGRALRPERCGVRPWGQPPSPGPRPPPAPSAPQAFSVPLVTGGPCTVFMFLLSKYLLSFRLSCSHPLLPTATLPGQLLLQCGLLGTGPPPPPTQAGSGPSVCPQRPLLRPGGGR